MYYGYWEDHDCYEPKQCFPKKDKKHFPKKDDKKKAGFKQKNKSNTNGKQYANAIVKGDVENEVELAAIAVNVQVANVALNAGVNFNVLSIVEQENINVKID